MKHSTLVRSAAAIVMVMATTACNRSEARAKEVVLANIPDPGSAQFGRFKQVDSKKRDWACLEVNYKGPAGGFVGMATARFVKPAGAEDWKYQGIAGAYDDCVRMLYEMQPFEGGAR